MTDEEFLVLVERYLDGALGLEERESLRQAVVSDPRLRTLFTEHVRAGLELRSFLKSEQAEEAKLRAEILLSVDSETREFKVVRSIEDRLGVRLSREPGRKTTRLIKRTTLRRRPMSSRLAYWVAGIAAAGFVASLVALVISSQGGENVAPDPTAPAPRGPAARTASSERGPATERGREEAAPRNAKVPAAPERSRLPQPPRPSEESRKPLRSEAERKPVERRVATGPAKVMRVHGEAFVLGVVKKVPVRVGTDLMAEQGLDVGSQGSRVTLRLADGTRLELDPETTISRVSGPRSADLGGRRVEITRGVLQAEVAPEAPMTIGTPHTDISIPKGTVRVLLEAGATRVEVRQGRAELTRAFGAPPVELVPGQYAVAATGGEPTPRAFREIVLPVDACAVETGTADAGAPAVPSLAYAALLKWDLSSVPAGSKVLFAGLTVYASDRVVRGIEAFEMKRPWADVPAPVFARGSLKVGASIGARVLTVLAPGRDGEHPVSLGVDGVALVQSWIDSPTGNHGLVFMDMPKPDQIVTDAEDVRFASRRPKLVIGIASP